MLNYKPQDDKEGRKELHDKLHDTFSELSDKVFEIMENLKAKYK